MNDHECDRMIMSGSLSTQRDDEHVKKQGGDIDSNNGDAKNKVPVTNANDISTLHEGGTSPDQTGDHNKEGGQTNNGVNNVVNEINFKSGESEEKRQRMMAAPTSQL